MHQAPLPLFIIYFFLYFFCNLISACALPCLYIFVKRIYRFNICNNLQHSFIFQFFQVCPQPFHAVCLSVHKKQAVRN